MRLIDVDLYCATICKCNRRECDKAKCPIHNAPTAYSVGKVVKELETDSSVKLYGSGNSDNYLIPVNRAIEIVKQGGVSDDVCEWRIKDDYHWHTGCRNKIDNMDNEVNTIEDYIEHTRFNYCPFCRKKIKVVGNDNKS